MPLTARRPCSDDALTTYPPGHIQNVYTPLPFSSCAVSLYAAAPSGPLSFLPYIASSIISCLCSARTPMANDLDFIATFRSKSIWNVSLALCPTAKTAASVSIRWHPFTIRQFSLGRISVTCEWKRNSPPSRIISSRILSTTSIKISVPIWGLLSHKISSGAPNFTNVSSTKRFRPNLSLTRVFNFPSEKVPAPPSPNCTFEAVFNMPSFQNCSTTFWRSLTGAPRSITRGSYPSKASKYAQNRPAGPLPITTGLFRSFLAPCSGIW